MKIGIDISPLDNTDHGLQHRVRGTGFYTEMLLASLKKLYPSNDYITFTIRNSLKGAVDIIHYPYFEPFFLTLPFRKKTKTVVTVHDLTPFVFPNNFPTGIKGSMKWFIQRNNLKNVDAIIADSEISKKDIIKYTGISEKNITVIYLAPGEEFSKMQVSKQNIVHLRKKYNLPDKFALYVGDVTWNKNLPCLIKAIKKTNVPLVMVGKALLQKEFDKNNLWNQDLVTVQNLIKNDKQITCLGFVPIEDLVSIYNMATVFVMPSIYEGFGLPILEAMRCGCPVIATRQGSLPEVAADAAFYVDAYSILEIAKGIHTVFLNDSLRKKLSLRGLKQAEKFSWNKTANETIAIYEKVINT